VWAVWDDEARQDREIERVVPDGCPELILHVGDAFARQDPRGLWVRQPPAFLAGTLTRPWSLRPGARPRTVGIRFCPGAAGHLLGVPMDESTDREMPLVDLAGASGQELEEAVEEAPGIDAALAAAERWTRDRLRGRAAERREARVALDVVLASRGRTPIREVARSLGWSRRRLERAFLRDVGIPPKRFARIVRLNAVLARLEADERGPAVEMALEAGYFDQAHLLRDFRSIAGAPPGRVVGPGELSRQLLRPERLARLFGD
jgi:AraC-like DNA-binding protein